MNTKALNSLAELICAAQEQDRTPMGIAFAIDAAGRHMSPEVAAELEALRSQVAELLAERHTTNEALSDAAERMRADRDRIAELEKDSRTLAALHAAGVDNWEGYDDAIKGVA